MGNPFLHIELNANDLPRALAFYEELFDWRIEQNPHKYMIRTGGDIGGGACVNREVGAASLWLPYVHVEDIHATVAQAKELGAQIIHDVMDISEEDTIASFRDPQGARISVWQPRNGRV